MYKRQELLRNFELIFVPLQAKIQLIRTLLNRCAANPNLTAEEREAILEGSNISTAEEEEYLSTNGKVYVIKVVTNPQSPSIAPQRQAIAFDNRGIAVLQGPLSFASNSDILIKELKSAFVFILSGISDFIYSNGSFLLFILKVV